jgi:hypothetical protein
MLIFTGRILMKLRTRFSLITPWIALLAAGCAPREPQTTEQAAAPHNPVERGSYLVAITACNDCHTPWAMGPQGPAPDMTRMLSGHPAALDASSLPSPQGDVWIWSGAATNTAFAGPWGVSYAVNLTPHDTGLGVWTEEIFMNSMRNGKHMGTGRPILPPMPWQAYSQMTDEDLGAIWAYLQTIPPIDNLPPQSVPAAPPTMPAGNQTGG